MRAETCKVLEYSCNCLDHTRRASQLKRLAVQTAIARPLGLVSRRVSRDDWKRGACSRSLLMCSSSSRMVAIRMRYAAG
eukprot:6210630-Pleurochrysis_carterae.AAC.4